MKKNKHEDNKRNPNLKLFKLLNNESFWFKLTSVSLNKYRVKQLREYRTKFIRPSIKVLTSFIEDDYKFITKDKRDTREIILDLLSE